MTTGMTSGDPQRVHDVGLQAERTRLAWARTALALAVVGTLELHVGRTDLALVNRIPGVLTLLTAAGCWAYGGRRYRRVIRTLGAGLPVVALAAGHAVLLAALLVLPAAAALWSVLV